MIKLIKLTKPRKIACLISLLNSKPCYYFHSNKFVQRTSTKDYHVVTEKEIISILKQLSIHYRIQRSYAQLQFCPFCPKRNFDDVTNQYTMGVNLQNGTYRCFRSSCQAKGRWTEFLKQIQLMGSSLMTTDIRSNSQGSELHPTIIEEQKYEYFEYHKHYQRMKLKQPESIYQYLSGKDWSKNQRGIDDSILDKYMIGIGFEEVYDSTVKIKKNLPLVYFPMFKFLGFKGDSTPDPHPQYEKSIQSKYNTQQFELVSCKLRGAGKELKHIQKIEPIHAAKGIFGLQLLKKDEKKIILTEGEFDAMAANQMTGLTSISLPYGISHYPNYLTEWLNKFNSIKEIFIWVDDDEFGISNSKNIAKKIGIHKTRLIQPSLIDPKNYPKDANDCLRFYSDKVWNYIEKSYKF